MRVYLCYALLWNPWRCSVECWLGNTDLVMWLWLWSSRVQFLAEAVNFTPVQNVQTASEAGPLSILFSGCQCSSQGVKHAGFGDDNLPPSSPKFGTEWSDTPSLPACLLCVHTDNFIFFNRLYLGISNSHFCTRRFKKASADIQIMQRIVLNSVFFGRWLIAVGQATSSADRHTDCYCCTPHVLQLLAQNCLWCLYCA